MKKQKWHCICQTKIIIRIRKSNRKALLWQAEMRDATVNFITYRVLQWHHTVSLP